VKIAKVHNYYLQPGGEDTVFLSECELLRSNGHEVIEYLEFNSKIMSMNKALVALQTLWSHSSYKAFYDFLKSHRPDVVHFHNIFPLLSPSVYYACQSMGVPVVQTLDNQRLMCPAANFYREGNLCLDCLGKTPPWASVLHACYHGSRSHTAVVASMLTLHRLLGTWREKVDAFLCSTNFYRDLFAQVGLPLEKLFVVPHFVEQATVPVSGDGETRNYALFVGRLDPEKGVKNLLDGWRHLNIPLKIRGDGQLEEYAKEYVKEYNMKTVEFIGRLDEIELRSLIGNARFLVMPSEGYYETFGMVIVEAFSLSVPVLASNIGVATEMVSAQKTGVMFEPGNPSDLAFKAQWMWDHPSELAIMGRNAYQEYKKRFTPEKCLDNLLDVYRWVLSKR
jgi:glycosyltransferase involved in cell wall biosynthesis